MAGVSMDFARQPSGVRLDAIQHRQEADSAARLLVKLGDHDRPAPALNRQLRVEALPETLGACVHDPAFRVHEVLLCRRIWHPVRTLALGVPVIVLASGLSLLRRRIGVLPTVPLPPWPHSGGSCAARYPLKPFRSRI